MRQRALLNWETEAPPRLFDDAAVDPHARVCCNEADERTVVATISDCQQLVAPRLLAIAKLAEGALAILFMQVARRG